MSEEETFNRLRHYSHVDENGHTYWRDHEHNLHRDGAPAFIDPGYRELWYQHGYLHREDGPAVVYADGDFKWFYLGVRHREDGPAVRAQGNDMWFIDGKRLTEQEFKEWQLTNKAKPL